MPETRTQIRLPTALYEEIRRLAEKDLRSINAQMVRLLQEAVAARKRAEREGLEDEIVSPELVAA
jgi:hypothetical protein